MRDTTVIQNRKIIQFEDLEFDYAILCFKSYSSKKSRLVMENLVHHRNSKAIVRIYEPIRLLPDVPLKPFLIPDAIKASHGNTMLLRIRIVYYKYSTYLCAIVTTWIHVFFPKVIKIFL